MTVSKKIVVAADGTATAADAEMLDVVTTVLSSDSAVTGTYGLVQKALLFIGGMSVQNYRKAATFNPFA
jgi:hypothetical protein